MGVAFITIHLFLTSVFIHKYSKEPELTGLKNNNIKKSNINEMEKSTSQMTDVSTLTSETL